MKQGKGVTTDIWGMLALEKEEKEKAEDDCVWRGEKRKSAIPTAGL